MELLRLPPGRLHSGGSQGDHRPVGMALPQSVRKFVFCLASVFVPREDGIWGQEPR